MTPSPALRIVLLATLLAVGWLVLPFADAVLVAAVATILGWPLRQRLHRARVHRGIATALSVVALTVGAVVPALALGWIVSRELTELMAQLAAVVEEGRLAAWFDRTASLPAVAWMVEQAGGPAGVQARVRDELLKAAGVLPGLVGTTAFAVVKITIFYLTLATLLHRGEAFAEWVVRLSPLEQEHTRKLFAVFAEFAQNVVVAGLVAAAAQGSVATLGYWLAGFERPITFGILTGAMAFVPVVGSAVAWVPVTALLALQGREGAAIFVVIWSIAVTTSVDNFLKPLVVRGRNDMPAVLVFLGVFGGLAGLGVIGVLVGPVLMALLIVLLRIYAEDRP